MKARFKKTFTAIISVALAAVMSLPVVLSGCGKKQKDAPFAVPESKLPIEEKYALNKYAYDELSDVQTTLRADVMNVTKRNLPRPETQLLSDKFSIVYDTQTKTLDHRYGELTPSTDTLKAASIEFVKYPYPGGAGGGDGSAALFAQAYQSAADAMGVDSADYVNYYKYMLLTQGQHLAKEASQRSKEGTLTQEWLKKHPAADLQYGAVKGTDNAVEKEITLDTIYRSYHATGLYLPAGEAVKVKVEGLAKGESISVFIGLQSSLAWRGSTNDADFNAITGGLSSVSAVPTDAFFTKADVLTANGKFFGYATRNDAGGATHPFIHNQYIRQSNKLPWLTAEFVFDADGEYTIGTPFGGIMHINPRNCYSRVKTTFTGAVETPHYILGVTTPQYFEQYLKDAPGVVGVIDTENGQLIGPTYEMGSNKMIRAIKMEEVDKLAMLWHSYFSVNESFTGGTYNRPNLVKFDQHVPAGAAVALGGYVYACPTGWFYDVTNYTKMLKSGSWGILHEIGHNHASSYGTIWGFGEGKEGEVRNNALTVLGYIMFSDTGTSVRNGTAGVEHGSAANPYTSMADYMRIKKTVKIGEDAYTDFSQLGYFDILSMYTNIMHSFGAEKFYELMYTYKAVSSYVQEGTGGNKRSDFAYRCSLIYGMNFLKYFNGAYKAGIKEEMFTAEQLSYMNSLPDYQPVSCYYAGTIDGVKTAGDYIVNYGAPVEFDLLGKTVSALDTDESKGFEIISVGEPEHGKISKVADGKYEYTFNGKYTGNTDEFKFKVKLSDGVIHEFTITLRINYNGAKVSTYSNVTSRTLDAAEAEIVSLTPVVSASTSPAISYRSQSVEVKVVEYYLTVPESGEYVLSLKGDDMVKAYLNDSLILTLLKDTTKYSEDLTYTANFEAGKMYKVKLFNLNTGGVGAAALGIKKTGAENFADVSGANAYHIDYVSDKPATPYVYEPKFLVSKKDNIKISNAGTDKGEWEIIKAPENIVGGRFYTEQQVDPETGVPIEGSVVEYDRWQFLIDGQAGTNMHTTYGGGVPKITAENPHEFILDTSRVQTFNYFAVTTRNNVNSYITDFELYISDSPDDGWRKIGEGNRESYSGLTITLKFAQERGRYFKLLVKGTTGGNFSVLAELDAGVQSTTQRVIAPTSSKLFATKGWKNSSQIESEPNGYLIAEKKNQKLVIKFEGESITLYAATGAGYGKAKVKIDGKTVDTINLDSEESQPRKLAFYTENLKDKEHTVEIITQNSGKVMLNVIGIPYTADLINASNIYLERALIISLVVFIALFLLALAFIMLLIFLPKFRNLVFGKKTAKKQESKNLKQTEKEEEEKPAPATKTAPAAKPAVKKTQTAKPAEKQQPKKPAAKTTKTEGTVSTKKKK